MKNITIEKLHGILTYYEMRKGGPSYIIDETFKATYKGKQKEELKETSYISDEEESNFVKQLQVGTHKFRGMLTLKCFSYGRVHHYIARCPYK